MARKILLIEDEEKIARFTELELVHEGYEVTKAFNGREGLELAEKGGFDLVLLDVMLPEIDGITLLKKMKADSALCRIPVIMATAKGTEYDKVQSLDLGADDYLVKPFGMLEMVSRVRAVLRRCQTGPAPVQALSGLVLNPEAHTVTVDGQRVSLTFKEFALLQLFLEHPGVAFTREQLLSQVWDTDFLGETRTVDMHIRTLRQKLGRYGSWIETVRNVGYRLEAQNDG